MKPIRIAIIGFGKIAADQHVPSIAGNRARAGRDLEPLGARRRPDLHRLARTDPQRRRPRSGGDHHAARAALRDRPRMHPRRAPLPARKAADHRRSPRSQTSNALPRRSRSRCSRPGMRSTMRPSTQLRRRSPASASSRWKSCWHEDVHKWHPGQQWIWEPGGFGVFDPGINALSIATKIFPGGLFVEIRRAQVPGQRANADRRRHRLFEPRGRRAAHASLDWRRTEGEEWTIAIETSDGTTVRLENGGATLLLERRAASRRRPRRISRHLPRLRRSDRRAPQPGRRRALPPRGRLPARRPTHERRSRSHVMEQLCRRRIIEPAARVTTCAPAAGKAGDRNHNRRTQPGRRGLRRQSPARRRSPARRAR